MQKQLVEKLTLLLADTYVLYLKTQNYHWNVVGPHFYSLHKLFEEQYLQLAEAVDETAERIRIQGHLAPASLSEYLHLTTLKEGSARVSSNDMLLDLVKDHTKLLADLSAVLTIAQQNSEEGMLDWLTGRIAAHEKIRWMLSASCEQ